MNRPQENTSLLIDGLWLMAAALVSSLVLFALFALLSPSKATSHFLPHKKQMTLVERKAFQERVIWHDVSVVRFYRRHPSVLRTLAGRDSFRWHKAQQRWTTRELQETIRALTPRANSSWWAAVAYADRIFPGTRGWLWACSSSEGGHSIWVPNKQGSGAGGWMQFLSGTFYSNVDAAFAEARLRGHLVLDAWRSWYSPAGQAITAGSMRFHGRDRGQWYGASC